MGIGTPLLSGNTEPMVIHRGSGFGIMLCVPCLSSGEGSTEVTGERETCGALGWMFGV